MQIIIIALLVFLAGTLGTVTGFGLSTIMVPVMLTLGYPLTQTLLFVGIIHLFSDIWKILLFSKSLRFEIILPFIITGFIFSFLGAKLVFNLDEQILQRALAIFLFAYILFIYLKPDFKLKPNKKTASSGGAISGFLAGLTGIGGAVRSTFLTAFDLPKSAYISTSGAIAFAIDITRLGTYTFSGSRLPQNLTWSMLIFIPVSLLAAFFAKKVIKFIPQKYFRQFIAAALLIIALKLLLNP